MAAAREKAHRLAIAANDQPVSVMLDLVHPVRAGRRLGSTGRNAGVDEAIGTDAGSGESHLPLPGWENTVSNARA
jgi:hypothetical protein